MMRFEVLVSDQHVVLKHGLTSVWWSRSAPTPTNQPSTLSSSAFNPKPNTPTPEFRLIKECEEKATFAEFTCHGLAYGLVGLFLVDKLIVIRQAASVGRLPFGHKDEVFKVNKICVLSLCTRGESLGDLGLDKCTQDSCTRPVLIMPSPNEPPVMSASFTKDAAAEDASCLTFHSAGQAAFASCTPSTSTTISGGGGGGVQKTWNQIKLTASNVKPRVGGKLLSSGGHTSGGGEGANGGGGHTHTHSSGGRAMDEREKYERRFIDELYKMFNETNSFYFSWTGDLTNSVQRQQKLRLHHQPNDIRLTPLWRRVDDRFFWNKYMLRAVIEAFGGAGLATANTATVSAAASSNMDTPTNEVRPSIGGSEMSEATTSTTTTTTTSMTTAEQDLRHTYSHIWILPIIQGFVQIEKCFFDLAESSPVGSSSNNNNDGGGHKDFPSSSSPSPPPPPQTTTSVVSPTHKPAHHVAASGGGEDGHDHSNRKKPLPPVVGSTFLECRDYYLMTLISRRSRFRAGTRYKKRGLDDDGRCANYVETEQIFTYGSHTVSFVLVRGSVPLFWSQLGHKYRPPPRLERSEGDNLQAFRRHFEHEFAIYEGDTVAVSLIEKSGREKILGDAFLDAAVKMDDARLVYVSFDFHDYCRGMKFENVSILIDRIYDFVKEIRYCWVDDDGMICEQRGVFRINCVDCLDRTNIVMTAVAKTVMDIQLVRLGLLPPEGQLPSNSRRIFQLMWAHNGDIISRQYAGTAALKGDYTRTGERKITGVMRDGYNSANRYYLNRFKDAYRQAVIDIMQGCPVSDSLITSPDHESSASKSSSNTVAGVTSAVTAAVTSSMSKSASGTALSGGAGGGGSLSNDQEYHERIKQVIEDCKKILVPQEEVILGGWPLVDADPTTGTSLSATRINGELPESEMDIVLILTKDCYYVADYDDQTDRIVKYQKVLLEDLEKIELGAEPNYNAGPFGPIRGSGGGGGGGNSARNVISYSVRLHYCIGDQSGYFHMFRSTGTRFFNNMAIPIRTREEALESLKAICESFKVALSVKELNVPFHEVSRLERRKSKRLYSSSSFKLNTDSANSGGGGGGNAHTEHGNMGQQSNNGRNNGGSSGSRKLLTGMYSHFSRLRGKLTGNGSGGGSGNAVGPINTSTRPSLLLDGVQVSSAKSAVVVPALYDQECVPSMAQSLPAPLVPQQTARPFTTTTTNNQQTVPQIFEGGVDELNEDDESDNDEVEEEEEEEEEDSMYKLRAAARRQQQQRRSCSSGQSSSSSLVVERTFSSDLSESDLDDSDVLLPPISELGLPGDDEPLCGARADQDRVLESCGILVTSPPLVRNTASPGFGHRGAATPTNAATDQRRDSSPTLVRHHSMVTDHSATTPPLKTKSVLHDVDDFVLDSMKAASLRALRQKAVSKSQMSLCSSNASIHSGGGANQSQPHHHQQQHSPSIHVDHQDSGRCSSNRCIFSSELALNSIASQSIKRDILGNGGGSSMGGGGGALMLANHHRPLSSSVSTDALDSGPGGALHHMADSVNLAAYPLISSSSYALAYPFDSDHGSQSLNVLPEAYELMTDGGGGGGGFCPDSMASLMHRNTLDSATLSAIAPKDSSLSVSDLSSALHSTNMKTSHSSTTLQTTSNSGSVSLHLPSISSGSSIGDDGCSTSGIGSSLLPSSLSSVNVASVANANTLHQPNTTSSASSNFTSSLMVKKDLVLSPLTRIAKGMQSIGLNLRNSSGQSSGDQSSGDSEAQRQRKLASRSRIIEM